MRGNSESKKRKIEHWQVVTLLLIAYDFLAVIMSYFLTLWIRFDCEFSEIDLPYLHIYYKTILVYALFCIVFFGVLRLYKSIWRFASYTELLRMVCAPVITGMTYCVFVSVFITRMLVSYYIFEILIQFTLTLGVRFSYRFILLLRGRKNSDIRQKRVMIIGAGEPGQMILRDIKNSKEVNKKVCCFIDDNQNKRGGYIDNVLVFGGRDSIIEAVKKYDIEKIYVAMPSAKLEDKRENLHICDETSCELMNLPGMYQLYTGEVLVSKMKPVWIEDLLGRDPIKTDMTEVFEQYRPDIVYHAAAHKHVPLMEDSPCEAIKNNVVETYKTAYAAMAHGCKRFVLISTDKAVNPTNIMGASKRLCEMIIQAFHAKIKEGKAYEIPQLFTHGMNEVVTAPKIVEALKTTKTEFVAVRFGNVLGSNGSVVPLFKKQIEAGGPVTVTHLDIIRYIRCRY